MKHNFNDNHIDESKRVAWIDTVKGLGIVLVVLGHNNYLMIPPGKLYNIIFSFHIPLFFFISGFLSNEKHTFTHLCQKRFDSLLKPYIFTMILVTVVYTFARRDHSLLTNTFYAFWANGPSLPRSWMHLWFLPHLFIVNLFAMFLYKYINPYIRIIPLQFLIVIGLHVIGAGLISLFWGVEIYFSPVFLLLDINKFYLHGLPWSMDIIILTTSFFISGIMVKKYNYKALLINKVIAIVMAVIFFTLHFFYNFTIDLNMRRYDNIIISTLTAYTGIYICIYAAFHVSNCSKLISSLFAYLGRYSLFIYIFHPILQSKVYYYVAAFYPKKLGFAVIVSLVAGIILPLALNYFFIERYKFIRNWYYST